MTKPEHTRPFNMEHAKAGAPYCCRDGVEATVLKWDCKQPGMPILGMRGINDDPVQWCDNGATHDSYSYLVMTPLGCIDGKPVFVGDEIVMYAGTESARTTQALPHNRGFTDCTWPAPARQYPVTGMSAEDIKNIFQNPRLSVDDKWIAVANAALRREFDNGQLFTKEDKDAAYNKGLDDGLTYTNENWKRRERAIARAAIEAIGRANGDTYSYQDNFVNDIISSVKD